MQFIVIHKTLLSEESFTGDIINVFEAPPDGLEDMKRKKNTASH